VRVLLVTKAFLLTSLFQLAYFRYNFSNTTVSGYAPNTVPNPNLGWETFQVDAGLDVGLFNNRVTLVADYYYKKQPIYY
jgi:hypothetical protein